MMRKIRRAVKCVTMAGVKNYGFFAREKYSPKDLRRSENLAIVSAGLLLAAILYQSTVWF
jgi:hypothetical protein